jgi:hypothetical protein
MAEAWKVFSWMIVLPSLALPIAFYAVFMGHTWAIFAFIGMMGVLIVTGQVVMIRRISVLH